MGDKLPEVIENLFAAHPVETVRAINAWVDAEDADSLELLLRHKDRHTYYKHFTLRYAIWGFLRLGVPGLERLRLALREAPGHIYPSAILKAVMLAAHGKLIPMRGAPNDITDVVEPIITPNLEQSAKTIWSEMVLESMNDESQFFSLIAIAYEGAAVGGSDDAAMVLAGLRDMSLTINQSLITRFRALINEELKEEKYQVFLKENPVFLDPLAIEVFPKEKLGTEFVTDYVVRTATGEYLVVEIEKPQDSLFTQGDDFTATFTHALGQVLDFQEWLEQNISYAQKKLPDISEPSGLLIMGRRTNLSTRQQRKLARFNLNSRRVTVLTYDDLIEKGERLYENLLRPTGK